MVYPLGRRFGSLKFTCEEKFALGKFTAVNMKNGGRHNVSKHRYFRDGDKYIILDISLDIGSLGKMRITSLKKKDNLGRSGKGLITSLGIKARARPKIFKRQGMSSEMLVWRTFQRLLGSLKIFHITVMRGGGPNMIPLPFTLPSNDTCEVYYESLWLQLAPWICNNIYDWCKTHSDLERLFCGW